MFNPSKATQYFRMRTVVRAGVILFLLWSLYFWASGSGTSPDDQPVAAEPPATTWQDPSQPGPTGPPTQQGPGTDSSATSDVPSTLIRRAVAFTQDYYLLRPNDTVASRTKRIRTYLSPSLRGFDLGIRSGTDADRVRVRQRQTIVGQVKLSTLQAGASDASGRVFDVTTETVLMVVTPNRGRAVYGEVYDRSTWQLENRRWKLTKFVRR